MDAQLEATYEGPEAVQRRQLTVTMTNELFLEQFRMWIAEMREVGFRRPGTGACTLASAMELWLWTLTHLQGATDADGAKLYHGTRQGVTFPLADALCWLLASRYQILDVLELEAKGPENPVVAEGLTGLVNFLWFVPGAAGPAGGSSESAAHGRPHPPKAGPCVRFDGLEEFVRLRLRLDGCLTGARLAKDRAATALTTVMIPEVLDYPQ